MRTIAIRALTFAALPAVLHAGVYNVKVVTDASPDYHDLPSLVRSITSRWQTPAEKCWAVFYWNHKARRQTAPINLHGMDLTDPIRQFNDYGYTMCSTISGINQSIWEAMGLKHRYWDISMHTVPEVFYDGRWHMYDNSMSAIYTLCDGRTIAGVEDIGREGACEASGGRSEPGHIARYHCLNATSPRGFLTGADCIRSLDEEYRCFSPKGLKLRTYFYDWDYGHRYILNIRPGENYTRHYRGLGDSPEFRIVNPDGKDPEKVNPRYRLRGNGVWLFKPSLTPAGLPDAVISSVNIAAEETGGLRPAAAGAGAEAVFKVQTANVATSQKIDAAFVRRTEADHAEILISTTNGLRWKPVWKAAGTGAVAADIALTQEVNGAYEILVKVVLRAAGSPADAMLKDISIATTTHLNSKTQPRLNLGRNTVYVGAGDQTDSIVFWPELQGGRYRDMIVEEKNIRCVDRHIGYQGALYPAAAKEDAYIVYRIDAPGDITRLSFGGRFYNRAPRSRIELHCSFDDGRTWRHAWSLTDTSQPWDVIRYETADAPPGCRRALVKYLMNTTDPSPAGCSIYAVRMEAAYRPADTVFRPLEITFRWAEAQKDRSLVERSHTQVVESLPARYVINVGGEDHPVMRSLTVAHRDPAGPRPGYSDGRDAGGEKFVGRWATYGRNIAVGCKYTVSHPSRDNWGAGDPDGTKLTDGVAGPAYAGGTSYRSGLIWNANTNPVITLDLGSVRRCAAVGMNFHGYPWWDALKGEIRDVVEVFISDDGSQYKPAGVLHTDLRWKDLPANYMWPDEETITGATFRLIPAAPIEARFIQYRVKSPRMFCATELEVLDAISFEPFDLRIALPE